MIPMTTTWPKRVSADKVIRFIETHCRIPDGPDIGQPLKLAPFQEAFIRAIYDNPHGATRRAILSTGRKNSKTTLCACLLLAHLCGPAARRNSNLYSAAQSRDQAAILFGVAVKIIRLNPELLRAVRIQETLKSLICDELKTSYRALSSDVSTNFGLNWTFCVIDELGQTRGPSDPLFAALETATGAAADPLSVIISTQPPRDDDLLATLIDDGRAGEDPHTIVHVYSAPPEMDPFSLEAIAAANPGLDHFMNKAEILRMAAEAKRMPSRETEYRNLVLNQRVDLEAAGDPFVTREVWLANGEPPHDLRHCRCWAGLDLSIGEHDFSCFSMIGQDPVDATWSIVPEFWLASHDLIGREQRDKRPYADWARRGLITLSEGRVIDYDEAARRVWALDRIYRFQAIAFDRYNFGHFRLGLERAGYSDREIDEKFIAFGQGLASMTGAVRAFETALLQHQVRHGSHPILNDHVSAAMVEHGDAGARKFVRRHARSRIDGAVATAMAFGAVPLKHIQPVDINALIG
jgi:phage terminase large subunit-like protein